MTEVREYHWKVTGWRAQVIGLTLLAIPIGGVFVAGFAAGRIL